MRTANNRQALANDSSWDQYLLEIKGFHATGDIVNRCRRPGEWAGEQMEQLILSIQFWSSATVPPHVSSILN